MMPYVFNSTLQRKTPLKAKTAIKCGGKAEGHPRDVRGSFLPKPGARSEKSCQNCGRRYWYWTNRPRRSCSRACTYALSVAQKANAARSRAESSQPHFAAHLVNNNDHTRRVEVMNTTELTVEDCLKELREMFPGSCPRIEFSDYRPIGGSLVVNVIAGGMELGHAATLSEAMAQVRQYWKENND